MGTEMKELTMPIYLRGLTCIFFSKKYTENKHEQFNIWNVRDIFLSFTNYFNAKFVSINFLPWIFKEVL